MDALNFAGWQPEKSVQVVLCEGIIRVLVKGQLYMSWRSGDEGCLRLAIVQLYECGLGTQEGLAEAFGRHVNSVQKYITEFAGEGMRGLIAERSGPKSPWKITPELRGKILLIVLRGRDLETGSHPAAAVGSLAGGGERGEHPAGVRGERA